VTSVTFTAADTAVSDVVAALDGAGIAFAAPREVTRTRLDTFDGRLHAAGLRLELRVPSTSGDGDAELVLSDGVGAPAHLPLEEPPVRLTSLAPATLPPGPFRGRLLAACGPRVLLPQVSVTSRRASGIASTEAGSPRAVVHVDSELLVAGSHAPVAWAAEVVTVTGQERAAERLRRRLGELAQVRHDGDALELAAQLAGVDPVGWPGTGDLGLDRQAPALHGYRAALRAYADAMEATWDGAVSDLDSEFLHDLRIGIRRTRALLVDGRRVIPGDVRKTARERFGWLGAVTSPARDLDVYVEGWGALTSPLDEAERAALQPIHDHLVRERSEAHLELARDLRSARASMIRRSWHTWLAHPDDEVPGGKHAGEPLGAVAAARIEDAYATVLSHGRAIGPDSPAADLHALRKDGKRLRYLLEAFGSMGGRQRSREVIGHLKRLQDNLGEHQDTHVQAERLRRTVAELIDRGDAEVAASTARAVERLAHVLDAREDEAREGFADRFAAYDRRSVRRTVADLLDRMRR
jgi:CHAD domain-containing protein